jgi:hypothetical protein
VSEDLPMSDDLISTLTLDELCAILQQAGYRVETANDPIAGVPYLRSATSGLAFDIRPGNRLAAAGEGRFADFSFVLVLHIAGETPMELINSWNVTRRFARLQISGSFVALCMDVSVVGGVTRIHLRAQIEIWDRLAQELIIHLREGLRKPAKGNGAAGDAARREGLDAVADAMESAAGAHDSF